jgi:hypothetical protein
MVNLWKDYIIQERKKMKSKNISHQWLMWTGILLICGVFLCCKSEGGGNGKLYIKIHDAPASYRKLEIDIHHIRIHRVGMGEGVGWSTVYTRIGGPIDLLDSRNGRYDTLVLNEVPLGKYDQLELYFIFSSVTIGDGTLHPLILPPNSTYTINCAFEIRESNMCQLSIDFDASSSVKENGGTYTLEPTVSVQNADLCGWIAGLVVDSVSTPIPAKIIAWGSGDSVSTLNDITQYGSFQILDLPEHSYSIKIVPADTLVWRDTTITSLSVTRGLARDVGIIRLRPE